MELFRKLTIQLGARTLLREQTLSVDRGTITVLMGPSGVGKSVLADVTFQLQSTENVHIEGEEGEASVFGALVVQEGGGLPHLTVEDNLKLVSRDAERRKQLIDRFDLPERQLSGNLSGGEKRRLATVLALLAERHLLWLDEPDAGLDVKRLQDLAGLLIEQARQYKRAIVVTTHNVGFAEKIADRIVFLAYDGSLEQLERASATELAQELEQRIEESEAQGPMHISSRRAWKPHPMDWLGQIGEGISLGWISITHAQSRRTFRHAYRLACWDGIFFYPFIGMIFGGVFVFVFKLAAPEFDTDRLLAEVGPTIVSRFSPPAAALLVAACAGSTISSWIGQMTAMRVLDAFSVLGNFVPRYISSPAWFGLTLAGITNASTFAIAMTLVFAGYIALKGSSDGLEKFWSGFVEDHQVAGALLKTTGFSTLIAGVTLGYATAPKRRPEDVATSVTQGIVWSSVVVMAAELILLALDYLWQ